MSLAMYPKLLVDGRTMEYPSHIINTINQLWGITVAGPVLKDFLINPSPEECLNIESNDGYSWYRVFKYPTVWILLPWAQDWDLEDDTSLDRSCGIIYIGSSDVAQTDLEAFVQGLQNCIDN
jgi:hypothetical protein